MKTTKTIEIEICEKCGNETRPDKCVHCGAECCNRCADSVHIAVDWLHPNPVTKYGGFSTNVKRVLDKYNAYLCTDCANALLATLRISKYTEDKDVRSYVVED